MRAGAADERSLLTTPETEKESSGPALHLAFFSIGAGAVVTYNAVVMAVAYFRLDGGLASSALCQFARWHNMMLVAVMCLLCFSPRKPRLRSHARMLLCAFAFAAGFNVTLLVIAAMRSSISGTVLYGLVAVNGAATGVSCSLGASVSGIFDAYSLSRGVGVTQLRGAAFGIFLPTVIQLAMLPLAVIDASRLAEQTAIAAGLSAAAAAVLCFSSIFATSRIARDPIFRESEHAERAGDETLGWRRCNNPIEDTIGRCSECGKHDFVKDRVRKVAPLALAQFLNTFCLVVMLLVSPDLPIVGHSRRQFWAAYLPTLCIAANNVCGYLGRSIDRPPPAPTAKWPAVYVLAAPLGYAGIRLYKVFHADMGINSNVIPLLFYAAVAFLVGRATVVFSQKAHQVCGHSHEFACPIVAQMNFIAIETGALAGAFVS